jgi:hypothetical protein
MKRIIADLTYLQGHLREGHLELLLSDNQYEEFKKLSIEEQQNKLREEAQVIADDYEVDDIGCIEDIFVRDEIC